MAVTAHAYPQFMQKLATKSVNLSSDTLKALLMASYTAANTHTTMADVKGAGTEATGTAYTAGGQTLTGVTITTTGTTTTLTAANPTWANSTITAAYAVFYDGTGGTDATNFPFVYWDFGGSQSSSNGSFTLTINASGIWQVTSTF